MTDDELEGVRERDAGPILGTYGYADQCATDRRRLLAEVDRLRGRRADEPWLSKIREQTTGYEMAEDFYALTVGDARRLYAHIDFIENVLCDLQGEDGPRMLREQGAAEERARGCAECQGKGRTLYDEVRADGTRTGFKLDYEEDAPSCPRCKGTGRIDDDRTTGACGASI